MNKWILIGGGVALLGGIIYFATRSPAPTPPPVGGIAPGQPGSKENPLHLAPSQLYGPQGTWGIREAGGQSILGQFVTPVKLFGQTQYKFKAVSSSPLPAATPPVDQAPQTTYAQQISTPGVTNITLKVGDTVLLTPDPRLGQGAQFVVNFGGVQDLGGNVFKAYAPGPAEIKLVGSAATVTVAVDVSGVLAGDTTFEITLNPALQRDLAIGLKLTETVHFILPPIPPGADMWAVVFESHGGSVSTIGPDAIQATSPGIVIVRYFPANKIGGAVGIPGFNIAVTVS